MSQFVKGGPRPPGSGRKKGQVGIRQQLAQENLLSAIEICRGSSKDDNPLAIMMNGARFLNTIAAAFAPRNTEGVDLGAIIRGTSKADLEFVRGFVVDACDIASKAAEFGYAKLRRIDHVGDQPQVPTTVENTFEFVLNISEKPGRPVSQQGVVGGYGDDVIDVEAEDASGER